MRFAANYGRIRGMGEKGDDMVFRNIIGRLEKFSLGPGPANYEVSNRYIYVPNDFLVKILNCRAVLDALNGHMRKVEQ